MKVLWWIANDQLSFVGRQSLFALDLLVTVFLGMGRPRPDIDLRYLASCAKVILAQVFLHVGRIDNLARLILPNHRCKAERIVIASRTTGMEAARMVATEGSGVAPGRVIVRSAVEGDCAVLDVLDSGAVHTGEVLGSLEALAGAQEKSCDGNKKGEI